MRTSLQYSVFKDTIIDPSGNKKEIIKSRDFIFSVSDAKNETAHIQTLNSFEDFLIAHGYSCNGFGHDSWDECVQRKNTKDFMYLYINVVNLEQKEEIKALYNEWKLSVLSQLPNR